ncbi:FtsX-like permease family protein [Streptomyces sp. NPDC058572]|uniref:FtsX-like permease family protein n=1 Tax=Streptomyces sp. NPDC058572 TaxID=3346546 RepID=UPI0036603737
MTGFVLRRVGAHRLLLAAALLAVVLTTSVLAALTAFSASVGDAALRHTLGGRDAASASLVVSAQVPDERRESAHDAVVRGARRTFDGLPVTVRKLERSGPYALPRSLQNPEARKGDPDLTHFAALDPSRIRLTAGVLPGPATAGDGPVPVALPEAAAKQLGLRPGSRLTLTDRMGGATQAIRVTGVYRAADPGDPYWQLDSLGGRGMRTVVFTTYGPLLADPSVLASGRTTSGTTAWLATADFRTLTTDRIGALRSAAAHGPEATGKDPAFAGGATVRTALRTVLDQTGRALLVARSTLLIVAVQLVLLAAYALLLVARLLSTERAGETDLLRARGASRGRIASLAAVEALLLAVPAAVCAPLLSGPLTRLLAERPELTRIGLRPGDGPAPQVWLVAAAVAVCCAAAVVAPALTAATGGLRRARSAALPAPVRSGADVGLLVVAAVAYWQLDRQTTASGSGALSGDREGDLGIDLLLVAAPALALLAGTVLTLRLLPPVARLAERRAAGGRGLEVALAGWQFSRRPLRGAGPVLLLVLAVAMGMLAIGQSASWDRSQGDQADFRTGASLRVLETGTSGPGDAGRYAAVPGVNEAAPAHRASVGLSGNRTATVLALDTALADEQLLLRGDLADEPPGRLLEAVGAARNAPTGVVLPDGTRRLTVELRITDEKSASGASPAGLAPKLTAVVEDRYGIAYRIPAGEVPADGRMHSVTVDLDRTALGGHSAPAGPLALTDLRLDGSVPGGPGEKHRLSVERLLAAGPGATARPFAAPDGLRWQATGTDMVDGQPQQPVTLRPTATGTRPLTVTYDVGPAPSRLQSGIEVTLPMEFGVRIGVERPAAPREVPAVATDEFLRASGAERGDSVDVNLAGAELRVTIVRTVRRLPTTGPGAASSVPSPAEEGSGTAAGQESGDGGALLLDLRMVNAHFAARAETSLTPTEWWLSTDAGKAAEVAAALRQRPDADPGQVLVRDEASGELLGDPLGAGPRSALTAVAVAAAALAAVGFAVSAAGSLRERSAELAVLRALGAPRRRLARTVAGEQSVLIAIALLVGLALGAVLTRAVVPLIVLTGRATQPVPSVLVELPLPQVALLLAGVAALPLLTVATIALRRADPAVTLRHQGDN